DVDEVDPRVGGWLRSRLERGSADLELRGGGSVSDDRASVLLLHAIVADRRNLAHGMAEDAREIDQRHFAIAQDRICKWLNQNVTGVKQRGKMRRRCFGISGRAQRTNRTTRDRRLDDDLACMPAQHCELRLSGRTA